MPCGELDMPNPLDPLTGLGNRGWLQQRLAAESERAMARGRPLSLVAIDLDNFTLLNERILLTGGDRVLAHVGRLLASVVRKTDIVGRDGGDQFTVIFPNTAADGAHRAAARIRAEIACADIDVRGTSVKVTASLGVASASPVDGGDPWNLFVRARNAVLRAKALGRNRVATD